MSKRYLIATFLIFFAWQCVGLTSQHSTDPVAKPKLQPRRFDPLPLGAIKPAGWLANQLKIQADGLSGHLDEFWPDIKESSWFGGESDAWERAPYWLDGVIPLAYLLDDRELISRIEKYMDTIIAGQDETGSIAPQKDLSRYDLWALFLVLKPLRQFHEATGDKRVPDVMLKSLRWIDNHIGSRPLFNWAKYRWFESLLSIYWLYERTGETWLLDLAVKLHAQGFDWIDFFKRWPITNPTPRGRWNYMGHVVNNGMAIKAPALWWRLTGDPADRDMVFNMIAQLDKYHGMVTGMFTGDECLAGLEPTQGTELCAVVEYQYSLEEAMSIIGDPRLGDRLEKITFNALPATFSPDMWSHQYDQQVNQVECSINEEHNWGTNGPESNIFGLEPNYGCCTSNLSQGWPKFASHLWMTSSRDNGLAAVAYAPCTVRTKINGVGVTVKVRTDYPFRNKISISVTTEKPVTFPLYLRIPAWANGATFQRQNRSIEHVAPGTFLKVVGNWEGTTTTSLNLPMKARTSRRFNGAIAIERGPLVYSLQVGEKWIQVNRDKPHRELPHGDWEVHPTTAWNYALDISEETLERDLKFEEHPLGLNPFSPQEAPVSATVKGMRLEGWKIKNGWAGQAPRSPVSRKGKLVKLSLIPYGCTNLRITEFPTLKR